MTATVAAMLALGPLSPVPLWPNGNPDGWHNQEPEKDYVENGIRMIREIDKPTLTPYLVPGGEKRPGVVVCPGGGYYILAYDYEGLEIAEYLNKQGINAFVLKYRLPRGQDLVKYRPALQDAQRAVSMVRARADEWGVDPKKVGIMGFSAGGHLSAATSTAPKRTYAAVDAADKASCKPDFTVLVYPAYLTGPGDTGTAPELVVNKSTPPTFLTVAEDDPYAFCSHEWLKALEAASVPVEHHFYAKGGHGFAMRNLQDDLAQWPGLLASWLKKR